MAGWEDFPYRSGVDIVWPPEYLFPINAKRLVFEKSGISAFLPIRFFLFLSTIFPADPFYWEQG
jgi:hypothetical protein